jgi:hypothetical protein
MAAPLPVSAGKEPLPREMLELCNEVGRLTPHQRDRLAPLCERVGHLMMLQSRLLRIAQDTVDSLHLDVRYLLFDLEVTRRERDEFQQELENLS